MEHAVHFRHRLACEKLTMAPRQAPDLRRGLGRERRDQYNSIPPTPLHHYLHDLLILFPCRRLEGYQY